MGKSGTGFMKEIDYTILRQVISYIASSESNVEEYNQYVMNYYFGCNKI